MVLGGNPCYGNRILCHAVPHCNLDQYSAAGPDVYKRQIRYHINDPEFRPEEEMDFRICVKLKTKQVLKKNIEMQILEAVVEMYEDIAEMTKDDNALSLIHIFWLGPVFHDCRRFLLYRNNRRHGGGDCL